MKPRVKKKPPKYFQELEARVATLEHYNAAHRARVNAAREILDEAEKERSHFQNAKDLLTPIFKDIQFVGKGVAVATLPKSIPAGYKLRTKGAKRANTKV